MTAAAAAPAAEETGAGETPPDAPTLWWTAAYLVTLEWGGSEEGGWCYTAGELVTDSGIYARLGAHPAAFPTERDACTHAGRMEAGLDALNAGRPPKHSVLGEGAYEVHVLEAPVLPRHWPETPPRYE